MKAYLEIEMPKNCNECPLHFYEGQGICSCCVLPTIEDDEILKPWKNKRKDCPIVPVPPHGRLIDAGLIMEKLKESCRTAFGDDGDIPECSGLSIVADYIESAPTVIPASEEGET